MSTHIISILSLLGDYKLLFSFASVNSCDLKEDKRQVSFSVTIRPAKVPAEEVGINYMMLHCDRNHPD
jgi:hypothetical protein